MKTKSFLIGAVVSTLLTKGIPNKEEFHSISVFVVSTLLTKGIPNVLQEFREGKIGCLHPSN